MNAQTKLGQTKLGIDPAPAPEPHGRRLGLRRWSPWASPLTRRVLAVNMVAPFLLVAGLFYLDRYKNELIAQEFESQQVRAEMVAAVLAEDAAPDAGAGLFKLSPNLVKQMLSRLAPPARLRVRIFDSEDNPVADSRDHLTEREPIEVEDLTPAPQGWFTRVFKAIYDFLLSTPLGAEDLPVYHERIQSRAINFKEVLLAQDGDAAHGLRKSVDQKLLLFTAVPIQHYKRVLGVVLVSDSGEDIAQSLFEVRLTIFETFAVALAVTIALSFYLAGTIARPIRRLAMAADRVRRGQGRRPVMPDLSARSDEIGELSAALRDMTDTLWRRMDAIETFAADVAHEIKNPLTSLRSAVETVGRVTDDGRRNQLLAIIADDVTRLDRLITDISDASRVDAELSRAESEVVPLRDMVQAMATLYEDIAAKQKTTLTITVNPDDPLAVNGIEGRLGQVLRNLLTNALSFSPEGGTVALSGGRENGQVVVRVVDDGPGIPENKLDAIFERFYSERPKDEKFGTHSGLGLSISRQIAEAHRGTLCAENRKRPDGSVAGAIFTLRLPGVR